MKSASGTRTNRWPPMAALVIGFLMVFLALPNPLRVPSNNPNPTAEIAPVPGQSTDQEGNFAETGLAGSPGLGAGGNTGEGFGIPELPQGREVPVDKECVGDPPRQTEDPLSPPCVPYFNGENGGATYQGVTRNEIKVVFYNALCAEGDMNTPYEPSQECGSPSDYQTVNIIKTIKYQLRYFQRRFQTYGRLVHVYAMPSSGATPEAQRTDAVTAQSLYRPFAGVWLGNDAQEFLGKMASFRIPTFGLNEDINTSYTERHAPYIFSFFPDQDVEARWSASYICDKLRPHELTARFSPDPLIQLKPRKLGFIYPTTAPGRGPALVELVGRLRHFLKLECDYEFDKEWGFPGGAGAGSREAARIMAEAKTSDITTLVCYCVPVQTELTVGTMQNAATAAEYFPEWYWDHQSRMDKAIWNQTYGSRYHNSIGTSYYWRNPAFREQLHYQAYSEETRDNSVPNVRFNFNIYHLFLNLFTAVQAAGPELTPEAVERGMFTFRYRNPDYEWLPTGGYGPDHPGTYTFIDTAMAFWWDPRGTPPGGKQGEGCIRVTGGGRRYYFDTWREGDQDIRFGNRGDPCSEDQQRLVDPQPGDF